MGMKIGVLEHFELRDKETSEWKGFKIHGTLLFFRYLGGKIRAQLENTKELNECGGVICVRECGGIC